MFGNVGIDSATKDFRWHTKGFRYFGLLREDIKRGFFVEDFGGESVYEVN